MTAPGPRIERVADLDALGSAAASGLIDLCLARQEEGAVPCVVLTGGGGGERVLRGLVAHPRLGSVDWQRVRFLWGDERWVPAGHGDRNDRLADDTLFAAVRVDPALVHRAPASDCGLSLDEAASAYAELVAGIPRIDLSLNGVGPDGHIASLFPGREDLLRADPGTPDAIPVRDSPKPPPERVSLTLPALNRAEHVWLLAAGAGKAAAVAGITAPGEPPLPAARLAGRVETVLWADEAALSPPVD
ncbi:6-phosphogluconolactonase [Leucobacter sp. wl10]|uniref:6-phosphogluconolactonase n=1 Tax=Leucobacter sp. wl10 TaxID=2304677 RepID=UPI000E5AFCAB|nr:6-phosphogluconolactonase [Leucobacter sp. wl10]RGE17937.1 6-phosphogluconolactonase [Leucobacter sp. wl10]